MRFKPRSSALLQIFLSAELRLRLVVLQQVAGGLRFDCVQCGSFAVFACICSFLRFYAVVESLSAKSGMEQSGGHMNTSQKTECNCFSN